MLNINFFIIGCLLKGQNVVCSYFANFNTLIHIAISCVFLFYVWAVVQIMFGFTFELRRWLLTWFSLMAYHRSEDTFMIVFNFNFE